MQEIILQARGDDKRVIKGTYMRMPAESFKECFEEEVEHQMSMLPFWLRVIARMAYDRIDVNLYNLFIEHKL